MDGLYGSVSTMPLGDVLLYLGSRQLSGTLQCEQGADRKMVVVSAGSAIMASGTRPQEYLGGYLVEKGYIDQGQLNQALEHSGNQRLGQWLVTNGAMGEDQVRAALVDKMRDTLMTLRDWTDGTFQFVAADVEVRGPWVEAAVDLLALPRDDQAPPPRLGGSWVQWHDMVGDAPATTEPSAVDANFSETFRREVEERLAERGRGKRFPKDLQRRAVTYYRTRTQQGSFLSEVARELGLPPPTLRRWVLDSPPEYLSHDASQALSLSSSPLSLRDAGNGHPVLVGPGGLRIEGLDLTSLAELLRRLEICA